MTCVPIPVRTRVRRLFPALLLATGLYLPATMVLHAEDAPQDWVPAVLVLYRRDHQFLLDDVLARVRRHELAYDFVLASQPWRARMGADFKVEKILAPLARSLAPGGRLLVVQSWGRDPASEVVQRLWPGESPFTVDRHVLLATLREALGDEAAGYELDDPDDDPPHLGFQHRPGREQ